MAAIQDPTQDIDLEKGVASATAAETVQKQSDSVEAAATVLGTGHSSSNPREREPKIIRPALKTLKVHIPASKPLAKSRRKKHRSLAAEDSRPLKAPLMYSDGTINSSELDRVKITALRPDLPRSWFETPAFFSTLARAFEREHKYGDRVVPNFKPKDGKMVVQESEEWKKLNDSARIAFEEETLNLKLLAMRDITRDYLLWELRIEMEGMLERGSTDRDQLLRIRDLVKLHEDIWPSSQKYPPTTKATQDESSQGSDSERGNAESDEYEGLAPLSNYYGGDSGRPQDRRNSDSNSTLSSLTSSSSSSYSRDVQVRNNSRHVRIESPEGPVRSRLRPERSWLCSLGNLLRSFWPFHSYLTPSRSPRTRFNSREAADKQMRTDAQTQNIGFWPRFTMAILGALALLVPMLIMAIRPTLEKSLITSNVSVFIFAVIVSWRSSGKPEDVLTSTATYAAVLVVFVALSDPAAT